MEVKKNTQYTQAQTAQPTRSPHSLTALHSLTCCTALTGLPHCTHRIPLTDSPHCTTLTGFATLHCTALHCTALHPETSPHSLHCTALHYTLACRTVLLCTALTALLFEGSSKLMSGRYRRRPRSVSTYLQQESERESRQAGRHSGRQAGTIRFTCKYAILLQARQP